MAIPFVRKYSVFDVIVILILVLPLLFIWIDAINHRHRRVSAYRVMDLANIRAVYMGIDRYTADNHGFGPGLESRGKLRYATVEDRYLDLLEHEYIVADAMLSAFEKKTLWKAGPVSSDHYSYTMLQLSQDSARLKSWNDQAGHEAVWLSGRNTGADATSGVQSVQTDSPGIWRGPVAWADGHVSHENDHFIDTRYVLDTPVSHDDNLFEADGDDDAYMIYTGN